MGTLQRCGNLKVLATLYIRFLQRCGNLTTLWEPYNVVGTLQPYKVLATLYIRFLQRCGNLTTLWELPENVVGTLQGCVCCDYIFAKVKKRENVTKCNFHNTCMLCFHENKIA